MPSHLEERLGEVSISWRGHSEKRGDWNGDTSQRGHPGDREGRDGDTTEWEMEDWYGDTPLEGTTRGQQDWCRDTFGGDSQGTRGVAAMGKHPKETWRAAMRTSMGTCRGRGNRDGDTS